MFFFFCHRDSSSEAASNRRISSPILRTDDLREAHERLETPPPTKPRKLVTPAVGKRGVDIPVKAIKIQTDRNKNTSKPGGTNDTIYEDRESPHTQSPLRPDGDNRRSGAYTPPNRNRRPDSKISPQGKPPLRREKSITQRREEERQIQKSRAFSNSYELSADLYNKQVSQRSSDN